MSNASVRAITCDHDDCDERQLITDGTREGVPLATALSRGWVAVEHRIPDDQIGTTESHYCPEHAIHHIDEQIYCTE